jgi:hypothetical protein
MAPRARSGAPIVDEKYILLADVVDRGIGTPILSVADVLVVPIGGEHHHDSESIQLVRAEKRVVGPGPVDVLQELGVFGAQLEPPAEEMAMLIDGVFGALQIVGAADDSFCYIVSRFDIVADGPCQARGEIIGTGFLAKLDGPVSSGAIAHTDLGATAAGVFL